MMYVVSTRVSSLVINVESPYSPSTSKSSGTSALTATSLELNEYGPAVSWTGSYVTDVACIAKACTNDFNFFVASGSSQAQLFGFGILGLGPVSKGDPTVSLVKALKEADQVSEPVVTIWLNDIYSNQKDINRSYTGIVTFGGHGN